MNEQLTLFEFMTDGTAARAQVPVQQAERKPEPQFPEVKTETVEAFLKSSGFSGVEINSYYRDVCVGDVVGNKIVSSEGTSGRLFRWPDEKGETKVLWCDPATGLLWGLSVQLTPFRIPVTFGYYARSVIQGAVEASASTAGKWKRVTKFLLPGEAQFMQTSDELRTILREHNPWGLKWAEEKKFSVESLVMAPQLEQLDKAGFGFVSTFSKRDHIQAVLAEYFNLLTQPGKSLKEIFKCEKFVYTALKDETSLSFWNSFRKMAKHGRITKDTVVQLAEARFREKELEQVSRLLGRQYEGKAVFTLDSLIAYLGRLDQYEAIDRAEVLIILDDYLQMCQQVGMKPRIDGDSLKREHDVAARIVRNKRNEIEAEKMKKGCEKLKRFNYSEAVFFVRGVESYDDLIDEAKQQHNCVASYAGRIGNGSSLIFFMRESAHPERSLITIELSPDGEIRQKFLACNQPIRNRAQSEFIERWLRVVKERMK